MLGAIMYGPGDVRVVDRDDPTVVGPPDAVIRLAATCICGSDLLITTTFRTVMLSIAQRVPA